ncbi:MAG: hypothetical protein COB51_10245 [Moraxellaceae bacterium]|nr:MAG: hypothetical protein COB51_10245 [Moraxellaceae bacterium]
MLFNTPVFGIPSLRFNAQSLDLDPLDKRSFKMEWLGKLDCNLNWMDSRLRGNDGGALESLGGEEIAGVRVDKGRACLLMARSVRLALNANGLR